MLAKHALDFVAALQSHFGADFAPEELNHIWPQLLECESKALAIAVHRAIRGRKELPTPRQLLQVTLHVQGRIREEEQIKTAPVEATRMPASVKGRLQALVGSW